MSLSPPFKPVIARVQCVEALRGISALLVLAYHYGSSLNGVYAQGDIGVLLCAGGFVGVDLFFLISGFVMVFVTRELHEARLVPFLLKRLVRVWPMTWLATLLFYFAQGNKLKDLVATRAAWSDWFFDQSYLGITWTIHFELIFYLVFALAFSISYRHRTLITSAIIIAVVIGLPWSYGVDFTLHPDVATSRVQELAAHLPLRSVWVTLGNPLCLEFIPGMILGELYLRLARSHRKPFALPSYAVPIAILLFAAGFFSHFSAGYPQDRVVKAVPYCIILMGTLLLAEVNGNLLSSPRLVQLGELTFSIYLFHLFVPHVFGMLPLLGDFRGLSYFLLSIATALILAWLSHYFIERPLMRWGRRGIRAFEQKFPRVAAFPLRADP